MLAEPLNTLLNAILNHTVVIYNATEEDWNAFNIMKAVFPWSGLLTRDVAGEMLKAVNADRKKEFVSSRVNL